MKARVTIDLDLDVDVLNADPKNLTDHAQDILYNAMDNAQFDTFESNAFDEVATIKVNPFTSEDDTVVLELARCALADGDVFDSFADKLDLSDDYMQALRRKIEKVTNGVDIETL